MAKNLRFVKSVLKITHFLISTQFLCHTKKSVLLNPLVENFGLNMSRYPKTELRKRRLPDRDQIEYFRLGFTSIFNAKSFSV